MSRKNIILLGVLILIIGLVIVVASLPKKNTEPGNGGEGTNFFSDLFNFIGIKNNNQGGNTPVKNIDGTGDSEELKNALFKISSMPVAGFGVLKKEVYTYVAPPENNEVASITETQGTTKPTPPETEYKNDVRYVTAENGSIYQYDTESGQEKKYMDYIMPSIHEAFFTKNSSAILMRYLNENSVVESFVRILPEEVLGGDALGEGKVTGYFLPSKVTDVSVAPDNNQLFYLFNTPSGVLGTIMSASGSNKTQVFSSVYTEWLSQWPNKDLITVTTKPSFGIPGYMYGINPNLKNFQKILGNINGLTTLTSPNGKMVLYTDDTLGLRLYDTESNDTINLNTRTMPEKCVWGVLSDRVFCAVPQFINSGEYPDAWYQGEVSFTDSLEEISLIGGESKKLTKLGEVTEPFDATKLTLSEDGNYLFFINKKDLYLWGLRLR